MWNFERISLLFCCCLLYKCQSTGAANAVATAAVGAGANGMGPPGMDRPVASPTATCSDDGGSAFINDTCQTEAECVGGGMMVCVKKRCQCASGYIEDPSQPSGTKQRQCVPVPSLLSSCKDVCQKPYECKVSSGPVGAEMMPPDRSASSGKMCQCPGKSRYVNGFCDAGCKEGQRVGIGGECVARCSKNEVLVEGVCKKLANVGEPCSENSECKAAFSTCNSGKCQCANGFTAQGQACQAKAYSCPYGDPLKKGNAVVACASPQGWVCTSNICPMGAAGGGGTAAAAKEAAARGEGQGSPSSMPLIARQVKSDSCPSGYYCNGYDSGSGDGHCCPKPIGKCPIGEPHPAGRCTGGFPSCPYQTHACVFVGAPGGGDAGSSLCCPKPCAGYDKIFVKGQCLPMAQYGDSCQTDEQCRNLNGVCTGGKCSCPAKAAAVDTGGPNKYCQMNCGSDEVAIATECKPRLKLGDSCVDGTYCPYGAYCNGKGICACPCGTKRLNDRFCAPPPYCPSANGAMPSKIDADKKYTYCKLTADTKAPIPAADSCPGKHFCAPYMETVGVCCPQPDPFCPDGSKPTGKKSCHSNGAICGPGEMCHVYYSSVTGRDASTLQQGSVCCPQGAIPMGAVASSGGMGGVAPQREGK